MLEARALTKTYSGIPAVRDVSFTVQPGQVLGYLGPNGSGKSTTVTMLTGLVEPTRGQILYRGESIRNCLVDYKRAIGSEVRVTAVARVEVSTHDRIANRRPVE